jgi:hypothetical protein
VLPEDPLIGLDDDSNFAMHPRESRLGFHLEERELDENATLRGRFEIDFLNGGSESREIPRMRLAYLELGLGAWRFLAGQDWDVISPLYPTCHLDGILWNAGNLGDRHPQFRVTFMPEMESADVVVHLAAAQTGAVSGQDLDGNALLDGVEAALPQVQGRIGVGIGAVKAGAWGHWSREKTKTAIAGQDEFTGWSVGGDATIMLGDYAVLKGEGWIGENMPDVRGGIGQGVNVLTGREIESAGGWGEIGVKVADPLWLYAGASFDDPNDADLPSRAEIESAFPGLGPGIVAARTGRTLNRVIYVSSRYKPWTPLRIGLEYFLWTTEYEGLDKGRASRLNAHFSFVF